MPAALRQLVAAVRDVPGYLLGAPDRWLMRVHSPEEVGDREFICLHHRKPVPWPCEEYLNAEWRSQH